VDESTAVEIGKILGAQYVIHGQVTSILDQLRMDMRAIDVETSEVVEAQKMTDRTSELLSVVVRMADSFASSLDLEAPSSRVLMEPIPTGATIEFSRGVDFEDKGDTSKALEHYRNALEIYPNHRAAQSAIARLESTGEGK
jgi:tetratricopeptide (TPR) repeat protein